jgi:hypothetical protein
VARDRWLHVADANTCRGCGDQTDVGRQVHPAGRRDDEVLCPECRALDVEELAVLRLVGPSKFRVTREQSA